jgi:tripartite-type tricarboxylate transporter receptor subunit TctC
MINCSARPFLLALLKELRRRFAALLPIVLLASPALGDDFYQGKQINLVVTADAGQSYDTFARLIGRYLTKYIPGTPAVVVQNMPGAGGLVATDWLYNVAPRDGLTIGLINNTLAFDPLFGDRLARFDSTKFNWLGSPSKETAVFIVGRDVPVDNLAEAHKRRLIFSATGTGSTPAFYARVFASMFDLNIKLIPGYKSQGEAFLALERGENDGNASPFWSSLTSDFPDWVEQRKIKILFYYGADRESQIHAPYVFDLINDPYKAELMRVADAGLAMGRPLVAPPGVDQEKVAILRTALDKVFEDPSYQADCARARLNCNAPSSGSDLLTLIKKTYAAPKGVIEQLSKIYLEGEKS